MKVTKNQLRSIIREAVRRKLDLGEDVPVYREPVQISGPIVTLEQLQQIVDEEYDDALIEHSVMNEDLFNYSGSEKKISKGNPRLEKVGKTVGMLKASVERLENAVSIGDEDSAANYLKRIKQFVQTAEAAMYGQN